MPESASHPWCTYSWVPTLFYFFTLGTRCLFLLKAIHLSFKKALELFALPRCQLTCLSNRSVENFSLWCKRVECKAVQHCVIEHWKSTLSLSWAAFTNVSPEVCGRFSFKRWLCSGLCRTNDGQDSSWVLKASRVLLLLMKLFSQL